VDDTHECPRDGCTRRVPPGMLMCRADWLRVPVPFRKALYAAWDSGRGAGTPAHRAAMLAAIQAVNEALAAPSPPKPTFAEFVRGLLGDCIDHEQEQHGRCVWCKPCGRRLYQGTKMTASERAELKEALAGPGQAERK